MYLIAFGVDGTCIFTNMLGVGVAPFPFLTVPILGVKFVFCQTIDVFGFCFSFKITAVPHYVDRKESRIMLIGRAVDAFGTLVLVIII